jgi:hypothetical protein
MLAEIAAANAAYAVIKTAIVNGKELWDCAEHLGTFFDSKRKLQEKAHAKGYKSDLQAFMELEKLKAQEQQLKEAMIYHGRPGMWDDWLQFQAEAKRNREQEEKRILQKKLNRQKRLKQLIEKLIITATIVLASVLLAFLVYAMVSLGK